MKRYKNSMTKLEIRDVLEKHYNKYYGKGEKDLFRKLSVNKVGEDYFFTLEGTPIKGFAVYIFTRRLLCVYDPEGKRFKSYYLGGGITELEK
jgi:hypothetical protein